MSLSDVRILEIDIKEFKENILKVQKHVGNDVTIMPIIKANGYGTHINKNLELIKEFKIVGVANSDEGEFLRKIGFENEIFVLNQPDKSEIEKIIKNHLTVGISDIEFVQLLNEYSKNISVHLEIDTGMGRTGIYYENLKEFINLLGNNIKVEGIYTHFAVADSDFEYTNSQIEKFNNAIAEAENLLGKLKYIHAGASNGIINFEKSYFNMIRPGILIYGYKSFDKTYEKINVKPIAKLKCKITYIKNIEAGTSISYGRTFIADKKMKIATIPIGYADGLRRYLSNNGNVVINGKKAKILGTVCMDSIMVDISSIDNVKIGDYAYIWDNKIITLEEVASQCDTINYEILCNISDRVKREFIL